MRWIRLSMLVAWLTLILDAPLLAAPLLAPDEEKRALAGEILVKVGDGPGEVKDFVVVGSIEAPIDTVFAAFTDYAHYQDLYGSITRSEVKKKETPGNAIAHLTFGIPWPIGDRWVLASYHADAPTYRVDWQRLEGSMQAFEGAAEFQTLSPTRTLMRYRTKVDLGVGLMPSWLFNWLQQQSLPSVVHDLRRHVKKLRLRIE